MQVLSDDRPFIYQRTTLFFKAELYVRQDQRTAELRLLYFRCAQPDLPTLLRDFVEVLNDLCDQLPATQQILHINLNPGNDRWISGRRGDLLLINGGPEEIASKLGWLRKVAEKMAQLYEEGITQGR